MPLLTRDEVLQAEDLPTAVVDVPEWKKGGQLMVRAMRAIELETYTNELRRGTGRKERTDFRNSRARLVARCCVNPDGSRVFSDEDVRKLSQKSAAPLDRLANRILELSGVTDEEQAELEGNSESGQS